MCEQEKQNLRKLFPTPDLGEQQKQNLEIRQKIAETFFSGTMEKMKDYLHPDVMTYDAPSLPWGGEYRGIDGFYHFGSLAHNWEKLDIKFELLTAGGDCVVDIVHFTGTGKKTGKTFSMPLIHLWRFKDGKVIEVRLFWYDAKRVCEVFGD